MVLIRFVAGGLTAGKPLAGRGPVPITRAAPSPTMRETVESGFKGVAMKIVGISTLAALALGVAAWGALPALAAPHHQTATRTLVVAMHDPGCHWFSLHGKLSKTASVTGPVRIVNRDEAALIVASRNGRQHIPLGKALVLQHGSYVVMMVGQAVDDNYLKLTVR
jgi:hypothetical protein